MAMRGSCGKLWTPMEVDSKCHNKIVYRDTADPLDDLEASQRMRVRRRNPIGQLLGRADQRRS